MTTPNRGVGKFTAQNFDAIFQTTQAPAGAPFDQVTYDGDLHGTPGDPDSHLAHSTMPANSAHA